MITVSKTFATVSVDVINISGSFLEGIPVQKSSWKLSNRKSATVRQLGCVEICSKIMIILTWFYITNYFIDQNLFSTNLVAAGVFSTSKQYVIESIFVRK